MLARQSRVFQRVYSYAVQGHTSGLEELTNSNKFLSSSLDFTEGLLTPVVLLAINGEHDAVNLLITQFGVNIDNAAFGYAIADNQAKIQEMLDRGASRRSIIRGLAYSNNKNELEKFYQPTKESYSDILLGAAMNDHVDPVMLKCLQDYEDVIEGYARANNVDAVNKIIAEKGALKPLIIRAYTGFLKSNHVMTAQNFVDHHKTIVAASDLYDFNLSDKPSSEKVVSHAPIEMIFEFYIRALSGNITDEKEANDFNVSPGWIIKGFIVGGHITQAENLLKLHPNILKTEIFSYLPLDQSALWQRLTVIKNPFLFDYIGKKATKNNNYKNTFQTLQLTKTFMSRYELTFTESVELSVRGFHSWLTAGFALVTDNRLPIDIFLLIASHISDLTTNAIKDMTHKIQLQLHRTSFIADLLYFDANNKYVNHFFKPQVSDETLNEASNLELAYRHSLSEGIKVLKTANTKLIAHQVAKKHANSESTSSLFNSPSAAKYNDDKFEQTISKHSKKLGI